MLQGFNVPDINDRTMALRSRTCRSVPSTAADPFRIGWTQQKRTQTMKLKTLLLATACSLGFGGAAFAFDQSIIDSIAGELASQGYTHMEVKISPSGAKIEASGPNGQIERLYDNAGNLLKEEHQDSSGSRGGSNSVIGSDDSNGGSDDGYDDDYDYDSNDDSANEDDDSGHAGNDDSNDDDSNDDEDDDSNDDEDDDSNDDEDDDNNDDD